MPVARRVNAPRGYHPAYVVSSFAVSGTVLDSEDAPLEGVTLTLGDYTAETGEDGTYTLTVLATTEGTLTPSITGYGFVPATITVESVTEALPDQDFVAYAVPTHVPEPDTAFNNIAPYIVDDGDGTFTALSKTAPYKAFDLEAYANITVNKTYYVATTGNDTTGTGTEAAPFATISKAIGMADVDKIIVAAGWYRPWGVAEPTRNVKIVGVGDVYVTQDWMGSLSWTLDTTHYEATCAAVVLAVMDKTALDGNGDWSLLTLKTSEAEVEANAASWWLNDPGNVLHVHTHDGRAPDSNVVVLFSTNAIVNWTIDNLKVYIENIKFITASGGVTIGNASSAGTATKAYLKDCTVDGADVSTYGFYALGCSEMILQNCTAKRTDDDGIRSNANASVNSNVIEIDCTMRNAGKSGDSSINGSSSHSDGLMVRINGSYHHTYGRGVHDYNNGHAWCLGVHANNGLTAGLPNFEMTSGEMWCDQCVSADSTYDYAGTIHKHDCTGDASDGAGTDTYDY